MTMAEDVNVKVIKKTQERLGKYIKKPPLQEKLLKRPPFRFLHDIITNVIKSTSFLQGLYTPEELVSDNVKDKDSKIKFLQKAIDALIFVTGDKLEVKPSKIVAGHEADKTNEFLQCIAKAIKSKVDSSEAVQKVLNGDKPDKNAKISPTKKTNVSSPEKKSDVQVQGIPDNEIQNENENEDEVTKENRSEKKKDSSKKSARASSRNPDRNREKSRMKEERSKERSKDKSRSSHSTRKRDSHQSGKNRNADDTNNEMKMINEETPPNESTLIENDEPEHNEMLTNDENLQNGSGSPEKVDPSLTNGQIGDEDEPKMRRKSSVMKDQRLVTPRPPSAKGPRRRTALNAGTPKREKKLKDVLKSATNRESSASKEPVPPPPTAASVRSARPGSRMLLRSARPSSARPAPPKIHRKDVIEELQVRSESVKPPENIILQDDDKGSDDETFLVMKDTSLSVDLIQDEAASKTKPEDGTDEAQGSLVKQLLETKKDLEGGSQRETQNKVEIEKPLIDNSQRRKQREFVAKEMDKLRGTIQTLTRSANPLGKLMDYLQEDIDSMQKEWKMWHQEYLQNTIALKQEESKTDKALEPLHVQLADLDTSIEDQQAKIHNFKSKIIHNEEKLKKLLSSINFASK
ncbi:TRAF3-interacting protein 1 [Nymphon striatum]|nr:TRAF3-interacting protein 1 [Nymphon striatum]